MARECGKLGSGEAQKIVKLYRYRLGDVVACDDDDTTTVTTTTTTTTATTTIWKADLSEARQPRNSQ
jgi:hypothetical protein